MQQKLAQPVQCGHTKVTGEQAELVAIGTQDGSGPVSKPPVVAASSGQNPTQFRSNLIRIRAATLSMNKSKLDNLWLQVGRGSMQFPGRRRNSAGKVRCMFCGVLQQFIESLLRASTGIAAGAFGLNGRERIASCGATGFIQVAVP